MLWTFCILCMKSHCWLTSCDNYMLQLAIKTWLWDCHHLRFIKPSFNSKGRLWVIFGSVVWRQEWAKWVLIFSCLVSMSPNASYLTAAVVCISSIWHHDTVSGITSCVARSCFHCFIASVILFYPYFYCHLDVNYCFAFASQVSAASETLCMFCWHSRIKNCRDYT